MLRDIDKNEITYMIHQQDYDRWRCNLSDEDHQEIMDVLHAVMDENRVFNSSHIPGSDWTGTPYLPIYVACNDNENHARLFYGLLVWEAVQTHEAEWYFKKEERLGDIPGGMYYFQPDVDS